MRLTLRRREGKKNHKNGKKQIPFWYSVKNLRIRMRTAMNLVSVLLKIPKTSPRHCYVNIRKSHELISRDQVRSQLGKCCKVTTPPVTQIRKIRVTDPNKALHPLLLLLLRPISKIITIVSGRVIRKWWKKLPPEEKAKVWNKIRSKQSFVSAFGSFAVIMFILYYYDHVVETPLTKRKRFIMISEDVMFKIAQYSSEIEMAKYKTDIIPPGHPFFQRARRVANAIVHANRDIPEVGKIPWTLVVIDRPDITNAFCFSDGKIFVFTGILNVCTNDDQLAIVLSHEMSHTILAHPTENLSKMYLVEAILLIPSFICWVVFTDIWAIISECVTNFLADVLIHLPFSRTLEREADTVGLLLAARACFDVREAPTFWSKMSVIESSFAPVEWLSTHPTCGTRQEDMSKILPSALELRSQSNCPSLRNHSWKHVWR